jgi:hypothetical protein
LRRDDEADISACGPDTMTRGEIVDLAIAAARREAPVIRVPPTLLFALAVALRPAYPRMAEVLDFITQALTNDFVAPRAGSRRLPDHFAGRQANGPPSHVSARATVTAARSLRNA